VPVDEERVAPERAAGDGVCVECGARIPREVLEKLADEFRCGACGHRHDTVTGPGAAEGLRKTA
jgi:hypothetical protein